jgi:hypothetical protein
MASANEYVEALKSAYDGEVAGVALAKILADRFGDDPDRGECCRVLGGVEARTRDLLADLLRDAGAPVDADASAPPDLGRAFADTAWRETNEQILDGLRTYARPLYARLPDLAPEPADERLRTVLHHVDVVETLFEGVVAGTPDLEPARAYVAASR